MKDTTVFGTKTLSDLLSDIHQASMDRREIILDVIGGLRKDMDSKGMDAAIMIAPIIKEYLDVLGHSDEHLVKIATIVQRIISAEAFQGGKTGDLNEILTDAEKEKLMKDVLREKEQAIQELKDTLVELEVELSKPVSSKSFTPAAKK
jgi:hypothetical protein